MNGPIDELGIIVEKIDHNKREGKEVLSILAWCFCLFIQ